MEEVNKKNWANSRKTKNNKAEKESEEVDAMLESCDEALREEGPKWKKRKLEEEKKKEEGNVEDQRALERNKRLNVIEKKKKQAEKKKEQKVWKREKVKVEVGRN